MRPPTTGPVAVDSPTTLPRAPKARARSAPRNRSWIRPTFCGMSMPPATPCSSRAASSHEAVCAAPVRALVTTNADRAIRYMRRRPTVSPRRPAGTRARPKVRAYPETTHCTVPADTPNSRSIEGRATFTMLTSSSTMSAPTRLTVRTRQRRASGMAGSSGLVMRCPRLRVVRRSGGSLAVRRALEDAVEGGQVASLVTEVAGEPKDVVGAVGGGQRDAEPTGHVAGQIEVLLHQPQREPGVVRQIEDERSARLQHGGADRAVRHDPQCQRAVDPRAGGEQQAFGQGEHLHGQADVDRELEHEPLPVGTDVRRRTERS